MSTLQEANLFSLEGSVTAVPQSSARSYSEVYEQNRRRVYALAFWMTGNELSAEELMTNAFCRVFKQSDIPTPEEIDCALIAEARQDMPLGTLTLNGALCNKVSSLRRNTLRVDLERVVVQLPDTEKLIFVMHDVENYSHACIARILDFTEDESRRGLHQARLRIRELLAT